MVSSYGGAVALFEKSKPFDEGDPNTRMLCTKRETGKAISRPEGLDEICFSYYNTELVRWVSPKQVLVGYYDSVSSRAFIDRFLPPGLYTLSVFGETYVGGVRAKGGQVLFQYDPATNKWVPDAEMVRKEYDFRVNRKRAAEIKRLFKPFLEWKEATEKLRGEKMGGRVEQVVGTAFLLNSILETNALPQERFMALANELPTGLNLLRVANNLGGAIEKVELPIGQIPRHPSTAYDRRYFPFRLTSIDDPQ